MKDEAKVLAAQVAIVTGGSGAIGRAILGAFEHAGARAVSLDLSEPGDKRAWVKCQRLPREVRHHGVFRKQSRTDWPG
jgi:NAD(P)-dependent dehydrogenase (short-subunit alcohol dehydrogenase family)